MKDRVTKLQCPTCDRRLKVKDLDHEKSIVCPKCNAKFRVDSRFVPTIVTRASELFGPPVNRAFVDDEKFRNSDDVRGAFEDIDHLFSGPAENIESRSSGKSSSEIRSARKRRPETAKVNPASRGGNSVTPLPATQQIEAVNRWENEKNTFTKTDERLQRNGIGLLILAAGIAFLPFVGQEVEEVRAVLPYVPAVAAIIAFVGSFMLAYSLRRGKLAAVIFSGLPFLLIGLVCVGGYFYQSGFGIPSMAAGNELRPAGAENQLEHPEAKLDDGFSIDRESINNNPAANFVPPKHDQAVTSDKKPMIDKEPEIEPAKPGAELEPKIKASSRQGSMSQKRSILQRRVSDELIRGRVNRSKLQSPGELRDNFTLSDVAGEPTVYGVALFFVEPIKGFDTAYLENRENRTLDMIVPIVGPNEFKDSISADPEEGLMLAGLNVNISSEGIVGLQGVFESESAGAKKSNWAGRTPDQESYPSIDAKGRRVYGIVSFKKQLRTVGVALILAKDRD